MPWPIDPKSLCDLLPIIMKYWWLKKSVLLSRTRWRAVVNMTDRGIIPQIFPDGTPLLPETGEPTHVNLMAALHSRANAQGITTDLPNMVDVGTSFLPSIATRTPWYCAGRPHNSSTKLPDDEVVGMGIGCHSISGFLTPDEITNFTQMGGEGAFWIGRSLFPNIVIVFRILVMAPMHIQATLIRAAVAMG